MSAASCTCHLVWSLAFDTPISQFYEKVQGVVFVWLDSQGVTDRGI